MKFLIVALLVVSAFSFRLQGQNKITQNHVKELEKSTMGKTMLAMIELHALAGGVIDELVSGIEELIVDLEEELQELHFQYGVLSNEFNSIIAAFQQEIQDAEIDIQRADDALVNLLKPRRSQLRARIDSLLENQSENKKTLKETNLLRKQQFEEYELLVEEYTAATEAVDEALALLSTLTNPPSLLQIRRVDNALKKIQDKIRPHSEHATLIKALIVLAQQNFSDQNIIGTIIEKLNEFRTQVVNALNNLTAQEAVNLAEYEARVAQLEAEYAEFQRAINDCTTDLDAVQNKIDELSMFVNQRDADRQMYEFLVELFQWVLALETEIYQNLSNEYLRELGIAEQALSMVESVDFSNINI